MNSNGLMMNQMMSPPNQIYNPFAYSSNSLNSFNNFGKLNSIRPMMNNDNLNNLNRNFWHHPTNLEQNKPVVNVPTSSIVNSQANKMKQFIPPRPLTRPDGMPAIPKVTEGELFLLIYFIILYNNLIIISSNIQYTHRHQSTGQWSRISTFISDSSQR